MAFSSARFLFAVFVAIVLLDLLFVVAKKRRSCDRKDGEVAVKTRTRTISSGERAGFKCCNKSMIEWRKDGALLSKSKEIVIRSGPLSVLVIKSLRPSHSGYYTCSSGNGSVVLESWKLSVVGRKIRNSQDPCVGPRESKLSSCKQYDFKQCKSFPGKPRNVTTKAQIANDKNSIPVVYVEWEKPLQGLTDLWGYQVRLVGLKGHAGYERCIQINNKTSVDSKGRLFWLFHDQLKFGAHYIVTVESLPALQTKGNAVSQHVTIKDKCDMPVTDEPLVECCAPGQLKGKAEANVSSIGEGYINVSWVFKCNRSVTKYQIRWTNLQNPMSCHGNDVVEGKSGSVYHYVIPLSEKCYQYITPSNYTVRVNGVNDAARKSETSLIFVSIHPPSPPPQSKAVQVITKETGLKVIVAVVGAVLGTLMCVLFLVYRRFFQRVSLKLPEPRAPTTPGSTAGADDDLLPQAEQEKSKVFIMHTKCCHKCSWVTHCLGSLLNSTGMIDVTLDMWHTLDIVPNVARWYEEQMRSSECVVVLVSHKMYLRSQTEPDDEDPLPIMYQLNLVRGDIAHSPETSKYVPVYFTHNSDKRDIPTCLSPRWAHTLLRDINRLIFLLTHVEEIQPYRSQPVVVMAADGHPYCDKKRELEKAVYAAAEHHQRQQNNSDV